MPINWRTGIEELEAAKATTSGATRQATADRQRAAAITEEQTRYHTSQIVGGLKGIGEAINNEELKARQKEAFELDKKVKTQGLENDAERLKIEQARATKSAEVDDVNIAAKKADMELKKTEADKVAKTEFETNRGIAESYAGKKPKEWKDWDVDARANYVKGKQAEDSKAASLSGQYLANKNAKLQADEAEIDITTKMRKLITEPSQAALLSSTPPAMAHLVNAKNLPDGGKAVIEHNEKVLAELEVKAAGAAENSRLTTEIAGLGGVKLLPSGRVDPESLKNWKESGFSGAFRNLSGNPQHLQIKAKMVGYLAVVAKDKTFGGLTRPGEITMAMNKAGGDPTSSNFDFDLFAKEIDAIWDKPGVAEAFFNTQASNNDEVRESARLAFQANGGLPFTDPDRKNAMMYNLAPASYRIPGSKEFEKYGDPTKVDPQEMSNIAWSSDPVTNKPLYQMPESNRQDWALKRTLEDPVAVAKMKETAAAYKTDYAWTGDNAKRAEAFKAHSTAAIVANSPGAQTIGDGEKPAAGGVGVPYDPRTGNPTTVTFFDSERGKHFPVTSPSLVPAAGATPASPDSLADYRKGVQQKGKLKDNYHIDVLGMFGADPDADTSGAYAAP